MAATSFQLLYYITHVENLPSIFGRGILSHRRIEQEGIQFTPIYDAEIVQHRRDKTTPDGRSLWEFANLYFQPRNAMLFRVVKEKSADHIAVLAVRPDVVNSQDVVITTGNDAASSASEFIPASRGRAAIPKILKKVNKAWWSDVDGSKREMMAECLIPQIIRPDLITMVYVGTEAALAKARASVPSDIVVARHPNMFFQPSMKHDLTRTLSLVEGDLFFSGMQTLTISVNTVGVMGKGLASTAKYRFPDVYVRYQDTCRSGALRMGKPYLVKRETSFDSQLADDPSTMANGGPETWFLLFATKQHWRDQADIAGIEQGLRWVRERYSKEGIESLAIPALGCGLGRLEWKDVGPLMCRYLAAIDVPTWIYLPTEKPLPLAQLSEDFLLGRNRPPERSAQLSLVAMEGPLS